MVVPPIPPEVLAQAASWAKRGIVTVVAPSAWNQIKKYISKDHGSKVKQGAFQECPLEMFGDKACIVVNEDSGEVVMLTSDTIQSYRYVKEKKRTVGLTRHTYFYYDITFKDGSESYVRMRRKYREAMESYT